MTSSEQRRQKREICSGRRVSEAGVGSLPGLWWWSTPGPGESVSSGASKNTSEKASWWVHIKMGGVWHVWLPGHRPHANAM